MNASGEMIQVGLRPAMIEAIEKTAASLDFTGNRALRILLHAGLSTLWPILKSTPDKQIRAYEHTLAMLRRRWENQDQSVCVPDPVATAAFKELDAEVSSLLGLCAQRSGTQWLEPADALAAYLVAVIQGMVLRWLADCDDETSLVVLDDLVSYLSTKAIDA
ncbi:TetR family transcriptional regulator [Nocardia yamanashiensis]|uniref:TetR family transcriptional regulator n=1 Tax=Nocardia yamanashiensis TaxID=209247 RepID=UPI001E2E13E5|nr:TetR family transcriptional regulator [Nocardia yamanashiensis]UGT38600.1 TetR family transcriptional regulator [Nocardia yamanashiensis]